MWQPLLLLQLFKVAGAWWRSFHLALPVRATHLPWIALLHDTGGTGLPGHEHWDLLSCPGGVWWHDSGRSARPRGGRSGNPAWHHPRELCAAGGVWRIPRGPPGPPCEAERVRSAVKENRTLTSSNSRLDRGAHSEDAVTSLQSTPITETETHLSYGLEEKLKKSYSHPSPSSKRRQI